MKHLQRQLFTFIILLSINQLHAQVKIPHSQKEDLAHTMSDKYWAQWDETTQKQIDENIARYRMADTTIVIPGLPARAKVHVELIKHRFFFGAHIFNYNQLGSYEANAKYRELWGTLFNSATVAFYWKTFEDQPGRVRFREEYWDTEEYWNEQKDPAYQMHWRRPSTDQVVDYLTQRGIRIHGHPFIWGNRKWHHPDWIDAALPNNEEKEFLHKMVTERATLQNYKDGDVFSEAYKALSPSQLSDSLSHYAKRLHEAFDQRIQRIAKHYGDRIESWDVVNESTVDYVTGCFKEPKPLCKSVYGIMPGDYVYNAFQTAAPLFGKKVKLNINDYNTSQAYTDWINELIHRGCRIDVVGSQMHLFNPQQCLDLAEGKTEGGLPTPEHVQKVMSTLSKTKLPIHLSEITITAPGNDERGQMIQAILARNLYRLWFSIPRMEGITWWNVVDNCGAPGEPSVSGIFSREMKPKPAYFALDELINHEWHTSLDLQPSEKERLSFRGFRGTYLISWKDRKGKLHTMNMELK